MNTKRFTTIFIIVLSLLLTLSVGMSAAQDAGNQPQPADPNSVGAAVSQQIPVQGQLTNTGGSPLEGEYQLTFRVYEVQTGGTPACTDAHLVSIENGLFSTSIGGCSPSVVDSKQLYLGVEVESDGEMIPRQPLYPVPYAYSLVQGAKLRGSVGSRPMFTVENSHNNDAIGIYGRTSSMSGTNIGVKGSSNSKEGYGGYFENTYTGGVALKAQGRFQSSAPTYIFIPGRAIVSSWNHADTDISSSSGAAQIRKGSAGSGDRQVTLPITIPGVMYGQKVRIIEV